MTLDQVLTLRIEKPAAGGRMIARHDGRVVLVAGAIPGELVTAGVERIERSLAFATVLEVIEPHAGRRRAAGDPRCGGASYAHIEPHEQRRLKEAVIRDALARLGRVPWEAPIPVTASPERGYRMRARLHVRDGRVGFFREGTHDLCDAAATGQLLDDTPVALAAIAAEVRHAGLTGDADLDVSENIPGTERAVHVDLDPGARWNHRALRLTAPGVTGFSWSTRGRNGDHVVGGEPVVADEFEWPQPDGATRRLTLRRHVRAFFQGNRFLLRPLMEAVMEACPAGDVTDLYAGVGLFGVSLAATGRHRVVAVEGHRASARDLRANAAAYSDVIDVREAPVERVVASREATAPTVVLDPPRTGMTREALAGLLAWAPARVVFVSCDVATFARDVRRFLDAGYALDRLQAFDLFPNTPHVEVVGVLNL